MSYTHALEREIETLREMLSAAIKERDDALARVAELIDAIACDSRNAILPPPPTGVIDCTYEADEDYNDEDEFT